MMVNVTLSIPEELKKAMERLPHVNWSEVARQAFAERIKREAMRKAADEIKKLHAEDKAAGWSAVQEIRRWRDARSRSP